MNSNRALCASLLVIVALATIGCGDETPSTSPTTGNTANNNPDDQPDAGNNANNQDNNARDVAVDLGDNNNTNNNPADVSMDVEEDLPPEPTLEWQSRIPFEETPTDPLEALSVPSCDVYGAETCNGGQLQTCAVYDVGSQTWVDTLDPLFERALLYDRWYDLYSSPDGITADRYFTQPMASGTPEETWAARENFAGYRGQVDGGIWTGAALNAHVMRYLVTGTEADYQRMEAKTRDLIKLFAVTGMDGYLARNPFIMVPPGSGTTDESIIVHATERQDHRHHPIVDPGSVEGLSSRFTDGFVNERGELVVGTAWWEGNPSIDQYTGATIGLPAAYGLLRDDRLKAQIVTHLTCYLKRLERLEIINLRQNPDLTEALQTYFNGGEVQLDPDDIDILDIDTIVVYYLPQFNALNADTYPAACPDAIQLEPTRVFDAASPTFLLDVLSLVDDAARENESVTGIDHFYIPSVRGDDAIHLMNLAAMGFAFTGDEMYRSFLTDELLGNIRAAEVSDTAYGFQQNYWCRKFFGNHIGFSPLWAFITHLADSPLRSHMQDVMHEEAWLRDNQFLGNAKFNLMYAGVVPESIATGRPRAIAEAIDILNDFGGNADADRVLDEPRRTYLRDFDQVVASLPDDIEPVCPTEAQRASCEDGFLLFGIQVEARPITQECTGASHECPMDNGLCAVKLASRPLPMRSRIWADFMWQRSPFRFFDLNWEDGGRRQSPGVDFLEAFWLARYYQFIDNGQGQVLGWRTTGDCN